ncbi:MAG: hypothetical protein HKP58_01340 [Desulfatitalea sp.]|nr:hypothetical protein [Desulfatitalea sp.]NNJ99030.1 hypothetical protein [Desulfatitalea sp.]
MASTSDINLIRENIFLLLTAQGIRPTEDFGAAPSTLINRRETRRRDTSA